MKRLLLAFTLAFAFAVALMFALERPAAAAEPGKKIRFHFENAELSQIVKAYSTASGQKFVVEGVRGKASILSPTEVTLEEAFALLSSALATNAYAISEQGDTMVIQSARNIQRNLIPMFTNELPPLKPERMVSWVVTLKYVSAGEINKTLRILPSRDGEMTVMGDNKLLVSDWVSNIHRIAKVLAEYDKADTKLPREATH